MTLFWLIRHGSIDTLGRSLAGRAPGTLLNAAGAAEVSALAQRVRRMAARDPGTFAVYSSPLERTLATARVLASELSCELTSLRAFSEIHFGAWTGKTFEELRGDDHWERFNAFRCGTAVPGGESMLQVQARAVRALLLLRARHPDHNVLVVTHGDVIKAVVMHFLGIPLDFCHRLEFSPASLTQLEVLSHSARLLSCNDTAHLHDLHDHGQVR
jgi:probable phosphoglycerate mutase